MAKCFCCGAEVIWGADFTFDDYGIDGDGIVSNWSCPDCGAEYEVYQRYDNE